MLTPTLIGESTTERVKEEIWACVLDDDVRKIGLYGMGGIEEVLERCAQLPLAIVTIVASFKPLIDDYEWRDALEELRTSVIRTNNREEQIDKEELIEHLIDERINKRMKSRQAEFDRGYTILRKLENACLLEGGNDLYEGMFVKIHDLVRDIVLDIANPQFMVEDRLGLEDFSEGKWREDLVKASLMYKDISTIPPNVSPRNPDLSTLLQGNQSLKNVSESLFEHLYGLKVLDLSYIGIESLSNSFFSLENLTTLRLRKCRKLKHVSSLAKLTTLRNLDLGETGITEVLDGLNMLVNLKFLNLDMLGLKVMPPGILLKISHLQYLAVSWHSKATVVDGEERASLKELETFACHFDDVDKFSMYIRSLENRRLACY
ncbi:putative disease resistance protein [Quercus suber]|uniref:Disease resistance protein n=1 Tax=Quercus suber TaxID=58331 RepID=A0AAW0LXZ5_QUESU